MWTGDYAYLLRQLILKDFKIRYRNMSLGVFWSLINPLVMMGIYVYVFTYIFKSPTRHFPVHLLSAIITFNFFAAAWQSSTTSILDNAGLIKRNPVRREIIPIAAILSNVPHLLIQMCLLIGVVYVDGLGVNIQWLWLPLVWGLELICLIGLGLITSSLYVFIRDVRYIVESFVLILFWLVPIIYTFEMVPDAMRNLYQYNPLAALVLATHEIVLKARAPSATLLIKLTFVAVLSLVLGIQTFKVAQRRFYEYL
ncbi:MAG: ABC transporter permease [Bryobacterales bacterium]|nr:ABC transporter permease [Bryobacterales bacterium]